MVAGLDSNVFFIQLGILKLVKMLGWGLVSKLLHLIHQLPLRILMHPIIKRPLEYKQVVIGDGCDLGIGAIILPGVHLGEGVQVGAGAVVSKSFPDNPSYCRCSSQGDCR